jgi:hypothetical protein
MPKNYLLLVLFCCSFAGFSQTISIKGKILDSKTQVPLEAATVYLTSVADSTVVDYTITDKHGAFVMNTRNITKPVFLKVSYVGYQTYKQEYKTLAEDKDFGILRIAENENMLGEVVVKGEAPPIRIKQDTLEFNVSSFKVRPDSNVENLLKQLPGVEIDTDGKIKVNGKEVNQVLVNGKPFFDKDGKIALQSLPSEIVNKVQITDTKTKREELTKAAASSNNSSINLTIDEDKNKGLFGKFMGGYGTDDRYESSALINYFKNKRKISVLASSNNINSTGFSMDEIWDNMGGGRNLQYSFNSEDNSLSIGSLRIRGGKGIIRSNMVGANYEDEWFKGLQSNGSYFYSSSNAENVNHTRQVNLLPTGNLTTLSDSNLKDERSGHNFNLNFEYKIDSTATIIFTPKYSTAKGKNWGNSHQSSYGSNNELLNDNTLQLSENTEKNTFTNTINFTKSFKRKGRFLSFMLENINSNEDAGALNKSLTQFYQSPDPDDVRDQNRNNRNIKDSYASEFEILEPVTDSLKVKIGAYGRWEKASEDRKTYDFNPVSQSYSDINEPLSNFFSSALLIITPKSGFSIQKKKLNVDVSVGTTITEMDNNSLYLGNKIDQDKTYIFPYITANGNYRFGKTKSLWASYEYLAAFPSAAQLLPVENLADPLNTYIGNPNLKLDDGHSLYMGFNDYDYASRSGYYIYAGVEYYNTERVSTTVFNSSGKRTTSYDNVSGTYRSRFNINWNKSIKREANTFRFSIGVGGNFNKSKGFTDAKLFVANSIVGTPRASFTYEYGELLTINPSYTLTYNETKYTNYLVSSASNVVHNFSTQITSYWPKNWIFGNDFSYTFNSNIADGFKKDFYLWNSSLAYNFFKRKFTAKVKVYDVLNQNQSATRTITPTTIRDEENTVLKRYAMFSLTYKIERFAGKEKPARNDWD